MKYIFGLLVPFLAGHGAAEGAETKLPTLTGRYALGESVWKEAMKLLSAELTAKCLDSCP